MASPVIERFWNDLITDIKKNKISLPALPEVIMKTRKLLDDDNSTAVQIARAISSDATITTRMLRLVNSPLYRTGHKIEDIKSAITRLGNKNVRSIITTLALEQIYNTTYSKPIQKILRETWEHGAHVAALSFLIARDYTTLHPLDPDEAMLAGLIHDIGKLPILEYIEVVPDVMINEAAMRKVIDVLHTRVGKLVLKTWGFSEDLITVVSEHEDVMRDPSVNLDYTDIVIVSNLLVHIGSKHPHTLLDWSKIPAFKRLGMTPEETIEIIKGATDELREIRELFSGS
jgi:putative nucleotidyltransferase with HDIG domain